MIDPPPAPPPTETVVVNATRLPTSPADAAFSIVKIDSAAIQTLPRLDTALETSAGLSLFRRGSSSGANPTTQGVSLRSIGPTAAGRALVTLDGVPLNDPFGNWVIWTGIPLEAVQDVSIVRGAGAGPYGAGALTGVVALDEKSSIDGHVMGDISGADLGGRRGAIAAADTVDGVKLFGAASAEDGDHWIPVREYRGAADQPLTLEDWNAAGKAVIPIGTAALVAEGGAYREARGSGTLYANAAAKGANAALTLVRQPDTTELGYRLQAWLRQSDLYNTSASISNNRNTATPADDEYKTPATGLGANAAVRKVAGWGSLELGADVRSADGQESELYSFAGDAFTKRRVAGGDTLQTGLYGEGAWRSGPWLLTGGARADAWQSTNGHRIETLISTNAVTLDPVIANRSGVLPTGRLGLRRDFDDGDYVRGAIYEGFRTPSINELYRPFRMGNNVTEANENLKPEKLYGAEIGAGDDLGALTWSTTVFVNQLRDAIANVTLGVGPGVFPRAGFVPAGGLFMQRQNLDSINAGGVEIDAHYHFAIPVILRLSGDYTVAKVDGGAIDPQLTGLRPAQTPRLTLTGGGEWTVIRDVSLSGDIRYEDMRYADDQNTLTLPSAATIDLRLDWRTTRNLGLYVSGENLTNSAVATDETADHVRSYDRPRVIRFGLRFRG